MTLGEAVTAETLELLERVFGEGLVVAIGNHSVHKLVPEMAYPTGELEGCHRAAQLICLACREPGAFDGGILWSRVHSTQGFARRDSHVSFATLENYGTAALSVMLGVYSPRSEYQRVIEVPFRVIGNCVEILGPEEVPVVVRKVPLKAGDYRLTCAQWIPDPYGDLYPQYPLAVDLFFEKIDEPLAHSRIIIADAELSPPDVLVEWAEPAVP